MVDAGKEGRSERTGCTQSRIKYSRSGPCTAAKATPHVRFGSCVTSAVMTIGGAQLYER
jgi:hypothetical protein